MGVIYLKKEFLYYKSVARVQFDSRPEMAPNRIYSRYSYDICFIQIPRASSNACALSLFLFHSNSLYSVLKFQYLDNLLHACFCIRVSGRCILQDLSLNTHIEHKIGEYINCYAKAYLTRQTRDCCPNVLRVFLK